MDKTYTILGAGLSGLSIADHLANRGIKYRLFEAKTHGGGHVYSELIEGFTWDEGPHVSFTKHEYVKKYFEKNCEDHYLEYPPQPTNYFKQNWIPHPAQSNMFALPEELRKKCLSDLVAIRSTHAEGYEPTNYQEWIDYAFGRTFADTFAKVYTQKYWTTPPVTLATDWIGKRVYFPEMGEMIESAAGPLEKQTHYISTVRYPEKGGFYSYIKKVEERLAIDFEKKLTYISFADKVISFSDGTSHVYEQLISTLPLPQLILNSDAPNEIKQAANLLKCAKVLLINVVVAHVATIPNHWVYVYDEEMYSTRINFTELLSPNNGEPGKSGIQVEVYFSDYHPLNQSIDEIEEKVLVELVTMKLIDHSSSIISHHHKWIEWANVIFDLQRIAAQEQILSWLVTHGLNREDDDLEPMTDWEGKSNAKLGDIVLAGRFAQWKYYWTDDCVMRGKYIAENLQ